VEFRPDFKVLVFSLAVAALVALAFGLAPALSATRSGGLPAVQSRAVIGGGNRLRTALVVIQVALSVVLVLGATLFVRSLLVAQSVDPGFATRGRVFVSTSTRPAGYTHEEQNALVDEVLARLRARPEVERASVSVMVPFRGTWSRDLDPTGSGDEEAPQIEVLMNAVGPDYFEAMGMTLLAGRGIEPGDRAADGSVLVVNETMAETLWPGESPVGKTLAMSSDEAADRVIGLVADADYQSLGEDPQPVAYASTYQVPFPRLIFVASTRGDARSLSRAVQEEIRAVDRNLPIARVDTIEEAIETQIGTYRLGARAVGTFGVLAAVLAAFGLYGVLSYVVASGTREIGIRMALGATGSGMLRAVVVNGLRMASIGIALGLAVALLSARVLAGMLYGIEPHDPLTFVLVPLGLLLIALVASAMPARRASGIDPVEALRAD
jgi:predicted permease